MARRIIVDQPRRQFARNRTRRFYDEYAQARSYEGSAGVPIYARRAGWGRLTDDRAYRIAQAHAAGYRVMRLRTYGYPGGPAGELTPYYPGDLD